MKRIGILVAVEIDTVLAKYKEDLRQETAGGFDVYMLARPDCEMYFVHSGAGQIKAAAAVQLLCSVYKIDLLINFGVVGALTGALGIAETCFVSRVVHYEMDTSAVDGCEVGRHLEYPDVYLPATARILEKVTEMYPAIPVVTAASGDKFVADAARKRELHEQFAADICDMESAAVVLITDLNNVPNLLIKSISDSITGGAEEYCSRAREAADVCMQIVEAVIRDGVI
ncbi:MAG: 5'-methylthioadenosine/S-adenosylhomocysteine nucleosidase [Mogibacterium sp.]|nr:5'-methylthioadenosine/S-adenosylhomocysteine nucleosidase [Mogibacterium sp.]